MEKNNKKILKPILGMKPAEPADFKEPHTSPGMGFFFTGRECEPMYEIKIKEIIEDKVFWACWLVMITAMFILLFCVAAGADVVTETIAYEASSEPLKGQIAVASVIKTRMAERGKSAEEVVLQPYQFSCWKDGEPTQGRELTDKELENALVAWEQARVWKYNHYAVVGCDPYWIREAKSKTQIGNHVFYEL